MSVANLGAYRQNREIVSDMKVLSKAIINCMPEKSQGWTGVTAMVVGSSLLMEHLENMETLEGFEQLKQYTKETLWACLNELSKTEFKQRG